jgi:4-hydroxy-tetrahydrodipicolinate reductase
MNVCFFGLHGKVGEALRPGLAAAGHEVRDGRANGPSGCEVSLDFTRPDAVGANVLASLRAGVPVVIGTTGFDTGEIDRLASTAGLPCFFAPNFALGAVLMMRFAAEASEVLERAEIVELHAETKRDAPSGTAVATAARMRGNVPIHSVRLPGLLAHQEVIVGGAGELLTIRHDTISRDAFLPGVLKALARIRDLPPGLTVGLDSLG